jgi:cysteine synthase A
MQGWTPDFIPLLAQEPNDKGVIDRVLKVMGANGVNWSKERARKEGNFVGISAGATFATAMGIAREAGQGASILAMLPGAGERYLSTPLLAGVEAETDEEEKSLAATTPGYRLSA